MTVRWAPVVVHDLNPPPPPTHTHTHIQWHDADTRYYYTADLLTLNFCRPGPHQEHRVAEVMKVTTTLLRNEVWAEALEGHPDQVLAQYIVDGLRCSFWTGFQRGGPIKVGT